MLNKFLVPDDNWTQDDLHRYGYISDDFYPIDAYNVSDFWRCNRFEIYCLHQDNACTLIESEDDLSEFIAQGKCFGIYKTDWLKFITEEATKELVNIATAGNEIERYFIKEFNYVPTDKQLDHIYEAIANEA